MFFKDIVKLQRDLDYILGNDLFPKSTFSRGLYPAVNLFEKDEGLILKADMPCVKKEDVNISLEGDALTITGERKSDNESDVTYHRRERKHGSFSRKVKLPYRVDSEKVHASINEGILTINFERDEHDKARQITIK